MLDEILEYQQYSFDTSDTDYNGRLKRSTLITGEFSGLERALKIIARHFLFDVYAGDEDRIEKTRDVLKYWLGHKEPKVSAGDEACALYRWLPKYVEDVMLQSSVQQVVFYANKNSLTDAEKGEIEAIVAGLNELDTPEEKQEWANRLFDKCDSLEFIPSNRSSHKSIVKAVVFLDKLANRKSFNQSGYSDAGETDDFRAIKYDTVLGNAIRLGRLKRYYLACENALINETANGLSKKRSKKDDDIILKMTAYCMLEMSKKGTEKVQRTKPVCINESDFVNWIVNDKCDRERLEKYTYKKELLFKHYTLGGQRDVSSGKKGTNVKKICLNSRWLQDSGFEILVDDPEKDVIGEFLQRNPNGCVFIDEGAGKTMTEMKKYR